MPAFISIASIPIASGPTNVYAPPLPIVVQPSACFGYTTAGDVASRALKMILVEAVDSPLEPDEYEDALDAMNSYMAALDADGIRLGYSRVCNVSDIVTIPDGAIRGLAANLAIELAPMFGGKVSATLIKQASEGMKTLLKYGVKIGQTRYPASLPFGLANDCYDTYTQQAQNAQITIAGNRRETVCEVEGGAYKAQGFWTIGQFSGLTPDISGRITNNGVRQTVTIEAELILTAADDILNAVIGFAKNAQIVMYTEAELSTSPATVLINGTVDLEPGQYLDLVVADTFTTTNITLTDGVVRLT
jgi:hypothetical protein